MLQSTRLLLIAAAGVVTTSAAVLFLTETVHAAGLLYPILVIAVLAVGTGIGAVQSPPARPVSLGTSLKAVAAFAAGMVLATIAFAAYTHYTSLGIEDRKHGVVWPLFAILFSGTVLIGVAAFAAATFVTSAIVRSRLSKRGHLRPDA